MKPIAPKAGGGYYLDQAHQKPPTTAGEATSRWGSFNHTTTVLRTINTAYAVIQNYAPILKV